MSDMIHQGLHGCTPVEKYVFPQDPYILERLEWFKDQKLALMMHYGPYSQLGLDASWALVDEDASWSRKDVDWESDATTFRNQYVNMYKTFQPLRLQPDKWAEMAARNGFRYFIFTTKHHDGFCMFDSQYTDYKITSPQCPFHTHRYANIAASVFDAFREKGLAIGAYFSKPDWHCPWYWAEGMEAPIASSRNPTYPTEKHPDVWESFVRFTHSQILELMENYGRIDILWLDGGQVNPLLGQDIRMNEIAAQARARQPWLITVDRTVASEYENYITPEQSIPEKPVSVPWESCVTLGTQWGFRFDDTYKSARTLVRMLIQVVSYGGNLALNIGPQPNGELPQRAVRELDALGDWMRLHGDAIYSTRPAAVPQAGSIYFTQKDASLYALIPLAEGESLPPTLFIPCEKDVQTVTCLTISSPLPFTQTDSGIEIHLSSSISAQDTLAVAFRLD